MLTHARVSWHVIVAAIIAALLIAALPQTADAAPTKRQRCIAAAEKALGRDIRASDYRIVLGSSRPSEVLRTSPRKDLICGFAGFEQVKGTIKRGDIFVAGWGPSSVARQTGGLVVGGNAIDIVNYMSGGRFVGRGSGKPGQDAQGDTVDEMRGGFFHGGNGVDFVVDLRGGRFAGGRGADGVGFLHRGIFLGQRGPDRVDHMTGGTYNGGSGTDKARGYKAGKLISVESCKPTKACP